MLQAAFARDGFVVVDLVGPEGVARLADRFEAQHHTPHDEWPWVHGFETSLYDPRRAYRAQVLHDAEAVLSKALEELLVDHRVMFANWVVKQPGADEVPLHADWTFLDEERYRSATVWCPIVDADLELDNGPLGVVVRSHEVIDFVRIANVPSYDRCVEAVASLERRVVPLRAGQAIVMDNRTVHFSTPNRSAEARVALGLVVGPSEAELHHYWLDPESNLRRFRLDRSFYLSYAIGSPEGTEGVLGVDLVDDQHAAHALR